MFPLSCFSVLNLLAYTVYIYIYIYVAVPQLGMGPNQAREPQGFRPFHVQGFHFEYLFWTHTQLSKSGTFGNGVCQEIRKKMREPKLDPRRPGRTYVIPLRWLPFCTKTLLLGNILHFCLLWFSGGNPHPLNCPKNPFVCSPSKVNQEKAGIWRLHFGYASQKSRSCQGGLQSERFFCGCQVGLKLAGIEFDDTREPELRAPS